MGEAVVSEFKDKGDAGQDLGHLDRNLAHMLFQRGAYFDHLLDVIVMHPEPRMLVCERRKRLTHKARVEQIGAPSQSRQ